jgi:hypothetical protein
MCAFRIVISYDRYKNTPAGYKATGVSEYRQEINRVRANISIRSTDVIPWSLLDIQN